MNYDVEQRLNSWIGYELFIARTAIRETCARHPVRNAVIAFVTAAGGAIATGVYRGEWDWMLVLPALGSALLVFLCLLFWGLIATPFEVHKAVSERVARDELDRLFAGLVGVRVHCEQAATELGRFIESGGVSAPTDQEAARIRALPGAVRDHFVEVIEHTKFAGAWTPPAPIEPGVGDRANLKLIHSVHSQTKHLLKRLDHRESGDDQV